VVNECVNKNADRNCTWIIVFIFAHGLSGWKYNR